MASVEELVRKYSSQLSQLQAIFPSWDESDLAFTLQDTKGNVEEAAMAITEGRASQFTSATKKKPVKAAPTHQGKGHTNRNADSGGWEAVSGERFGGRGGRGGTRGGRGGRGGEPTRGGRGGRGGFRGGRGGFANVNGAAPSGGYAGAAKKANGYPTTTETTEEGWATQVEQSNAAEADERADGLKHEPPAPASKADDFIAAGGLSDAPAAKEVEAAAKQGGSDWQEEIKKPVPAAKPKLTWAQIAKPVEKPKPALPPPAPKVEAPAPVTTEEPTTEAPEEVPEEIHEETPAEPEQAWGDAPAPAEVEEQAEEILEAEPESQTEPVEPQVEEAAWEDPAIASQSFAPSSQPVEAAPEPITTYTGPPGFNTVAAKAAAAQPRTASRAGRYRNADDQGVVLPAAASSVSAMEMQFGSLSFGGQGGDGVEAPVVEPSAEKTPAQPAPPLPTVTSPVRAPQPIAQPIAQPAPSQPSATPYYQQQQAPTHQSYQAPHQILQQQAPGYGSQFGQPQQQQPQAPSHDQYQQSFYRGGQHDYSSAFASQGQQQQQPAQESQHAPSTQHAQNSQQPTQSAPTQQHVASPYDSGFGGFGGSQLFGQPQHNQHQQSDAFGAAQRAYDSYGASGYPRPAAEEPKQTQQQQQQQQPPSQNPSAPAQPNLHQSQYYSQLSNMGYYQAAPYNPYYQYGQAPSPGFQQYYPLAARGGNLYGQPAPQQQQPAPIPQANKASPAPAHSPYGGPSPYPSAYDDQSSLSAGRYGDSKLQAGQQQQQGQAPGSYQSQGSAAGLHNFLGGNGGLSAGSRPQASTPDDGFKSQSAQSQTSAPGSQNRSTPLQQGNQQQQQQQQHGGFNYPYGAGGYGNQDWSQYGQQYGSRNGYSHWQQ